MNQTASPLSFVAIQAALRAGELLKKGFYSSYEIFSKPGKQNLVTEFDKSAEKCIISCIREHFPDHNFLAEESGMDRSSASPIMWIIDPLDGTVNFAHQIPLFSVSIAACEGQKVLCGVVYQPMTGELFVAEKGKGAYLNGTRLKVSSSIDMEMGIFATGFPYNVDENPQYCIDVFAEMTRMGLPIRRLGSAAIDLAYVAAGRFDAYWEVILQPWDMAAGILLVEEAGGKVTDYQDKRHDILQHGSMLASNGLVHEQLRKILIKKR
ncbi:MAG: inositol monophosphatase family protein [Chlamydiales bacterium]